ncbi:MAG: hypothetical protein KKB89_00495, partial [Candidatus Omnitrophica bacterium]|nr:hypothetical protein [Candidatus Omnitrophota bacterium]
KEVLSLFLVGTLEAVPKKIILAILLSKYSLNTAYPAGLGPVGLNSFKYPVNIQCKMQIVNCKS